MNQNHGSARISPPLFSLVAGGALLLFLLGVPFMNVPVFPYITLIIFFVFLTVLTRSKGVVILFALPAVLGFLVFPVETMSLFFSAIGAIGVIALSLRLKQYLVLLAAPAAYSIAFAVTLDPIHAIGALVFLPPALLVGILYANNAKRGTLIAAAVGSLFALLAIGFCLLVYLDRGSLSAETILAFIEEFKSLLLGEITAMFAELEMPVPTESLSGAFDAVLRLMPAILIIVCEVIGYFATLLALVLTKAHGDDTVPIRTSAFIMEPVSAVVFLIAALIALFSMSAGGVLGLTAQTLFLILAPGFALCEVLAYVAQMRTGLRISPFFLILLIIVAGSFLPMLLAFMGAFRILRNRRILNMDGQDRS